MHYFTNSDLELADMFKAQFQGKFTGNNFFVCINDLAQMTLGQNHDNN